MIEGDNIAANCKQRQAPGENNFKSSKVGLEIKKEITGPSHHCSIADKEQDASSRPICGKLSDGKSLDSGTYVKDFFPIGSSKGKNDSNILDSSDSSREEGCHTFGTSVDSDYLNIDRALYHGNEQGYAISRCRRCHFTSRVPFDACQCRKMSFDQKSISSPRERNCGDLKMNEMSQAIQGIQNRVETSDLSSVKEPCCLELDSTSQKYNDDIAILAGSGADFGFHVENIFGRSLLGIVSSIFRDHIPKLNPGAMISSLFSQEVDSREMRLSSSFNFDTFFGGVKWKLRLLRSVLTIVISPSSLDPDSSYDSSCVKSQQDNEGTYINTMTMHGALKLRHVLQELHWITGKKDLKKQLWQWRPTAVALLVVLPTSFAKIFWNIRRVVIKYFMGSSRLATTIACPNLWLENFGSNSKVLPERNVSKSLSDDTIKDKEGVFVEEAESQVKNPPTFDPADVRHRLQTFQGKGIARNRSEALADAGFYFTSDDMLVCYSCHIQRRIKSSDLDQAITPLWHDPACTHLLISRPSQKQVVSDGMVSDLPVDPPGQQSIYIPPGDARRESYRLSTFEQFPVTCPIGRKCLAESGFYYTGFYDRVKCFSCGRTVEEWRETDNPIELRWHRDGCPFPRGEECGNIPLSSLLESLTQAAPCTGSSSAPAGQTNPVTVADTILEQRDPNTGTVIRRVRCPADLSEKIRQTGGTFEIGPNNEVIIRSGPGPGQRNPVNAGLHATQLQSRKQWRMANVISADHKRFLTNLYLNRELDRLASFARWPVGRPNIAPAYLAKSGFFYLGDMDRTRCFSCGGVLRNWNLEDDAEVEHRTHFPLCPMVHGLEPRNVPVDERPETEEEKKRRYPCRFPANPHMRNEAARLQTFDRRWPMGKTAATPAEIAQAGFFFLGERDRAKCWYCNGGLQNWEYDDIPWVEHAKWFPNCQFLLRVKGQHFVYRHLALHPHLARPIIARQDGSPLESDGGQPLPAVYVGQAPGQRSQDIPPSEPRMNQPSATPVIIDPQEQLRKVGQRVENIMKNSDIVKTIIDMAFDPKIVADLLRDRILSGNEANPDDVYEGVRELLDDVQEVEKARKEKEQRNQGSKRMYICDQQEQGYLVDTGAVSSILPATIYEKENLPRRTNLKAANGSVIATYGKREMVLKLSNNKTYKYDFVIANVDERIVGADFLHYHKLDVQLSKNRLKDPDGSYINGTRRSASASTISSYAETSAEHLQGEEDMDEEECPSFSEIISIDSPFSNYSGVPGSDDEDMDESMEGTSSSIATLLKDGCDDAESLQEALNQIEERRLCKICFTNRADMVFIPCSHMCCCIECTQAITQCPVCRKKIEKAIKTYVT